MSHVGTEPRQRALGAHSLVTIVGFLVCVELASGILQGYYTPIFSDIADHLDISDADVNWFEAAQLIVSALAVPVLARLGDMVGAKYVLLLSTAITAVGSWVLAFAPSFTTFLVGWALQGAYVIWLPMEVANAVGALWEKTHAERGPDSDFTTIFQTVEQRAGLEPRTKKVG